LGGYAAPCGGKGRKEICDQVGKIDSIKNQIRDVTLDVGASTDTIIQEILLKIFRLKHLFDTTGMKVINLAYLINLNNVRILHAGDITIEFDKSLLDKLHFENEKIDILFLSYFDLSEVSIRYVKEVIKPKYVVAMHLPSMEYEVESKKFLHAFPNGIMFEKPMDKKIIDE
jgi:L-ascorbate metabolism protein UlaG (beta-lactamase superfamily)